MLRTEHDMHYGDTFIGNFLQGMGLRQRRPHMPVEAPWSSDTFRTFFPGAQWLGDGTDIIIRWGNESFAFNIEALIDSFTNSLVGFVVSDTEDEEALRIAYKAGVATVGTPPLALTLDNRPSNHSPGAVEATTGTLLLRSTPHRGQAKAPIEGSFGLFQQALPHLSIHGDTPREMARRALQLVFTAWARGRNGKPRHRLGGRSPAETYANARPTPEEIQEALVWFHDLQQQQERMRATQAARRDPVRKALLKQGLEELGIPDPDGRLEVALAYYGRDAIARGLAIFRTKQATRRPCPPPLTPGVISAASSVSLTPRWNLTSSLYTCSSNVSGYTTSPWLHWNALPDNFVPKWRPPLSLRPSSIRLSTPLLPLTSATGDRLPQIQCGRCPQTQRELLYTSLCRRIASIIPNGSSAARGLDR